MVRRRNDRHHGVPNREELELLIFVHTFHRGFFSYCELGTLFLCWNWCGLNFWTSF